VVKQYKSPPDDVKLVLSAVCVIMGVAAERKIDPNTQKPFQDYWPPALKMVSKIDFLDQILKYDKDNIEAKVVDKLKEFIDNPKFEPKALESVSMIASNLCTWCHAIYTFYHINLVVVPKKAKLKEAQEKYESVMSKLRVKQAELKVV
jgi:dynein heavy chain